MNILSQFKNIFTKATEKRSAAFFTSTNQFDTLCSEGYTRLDKNPEVVTCVRKIADLISSMTIHLMANTEHGDIRVVNELSKKVDIYPSEWMTRKTWMESIVMNMLLYGRGNAVVLPHTNGGLLGELEPISATRATFTAERRGYSINIDGVRHDPSDVLHFVFNPDPVNPWMGQGMNVTLQDVTNSLKQADTTKKGFLSSKWKPSVIVKVDALADEFSSPAGRKKLLDEYISTSEAGEPWLIPAEQFSVDSIRPLSLADLAINDVVQIDKKTVATLLGVPPFVVGVGNFNADEWNNFISTTVRPIAKEIEQELTRKLLVSPKMYWRFNIVSLYAYDLKTISSVYSELYVRGIATGNEVRDKVNLAPKDGLDDLVILENYIPLGKIGDQLKLGGADG